MNVTVKASIFAAIILLAALLSWASTPQIINYQGRLLDSSGEPMPDGNYVVSFSIYDSPTGGTVKWAESYSSVAVTDGLFEVNMGSSVPLSDTVFSGEDRYLEVSVGGQTLEPRTQFTSVSYAQRISTVDGANGGKVNGSLVLSPEDFTSLGNAITIVDSNDEPIMEFSIDASGLGSIAFYEPADSKAGTFKVMDISVSPAGLGTIGFYDPVDSKFGLAGAKRVEIQKDGLVMFGATEFDTSLIVANNGDIRGLGQITMGENSSDGVQTAVLGFDNSASGDSSSIGGGSFNVSAGTSSVIGGGFSNTTIGTGATIGGGSLNNATGDYSTIAGGSENITLGNFGVIPGGNLNAANGDNSFAAGYRAKAEHFGSFVWADQTEEDFFSTSPNQFIVRADGGVGIGTNSPVGLLDVSGDPGDSSVNLPNDAISSPEIFDEPGLSSERGPETILSQGLGSMQDLTVTSITIPSAGYIIVRGGGTLEASGSTKTNQVYLQIDEIPGGGVISPYYTLAGPGDQDAPSNLHYFSLSCERIYEKPAGTYEFRLEAQTNPTNGDGAITKIKNPYVTAMYVPTAYGNVFSSSSN